MIFIRFLTGTVFLAILIALMTAIGTVADRIIDGVWHIVPSNFLLGVLVTCCTGAVICTILAIGGVLLEIFEFGP